MAGSIKKRPFYGKQTQEVSAYEAPHREIARKAAAEGIVLLKNKNQVLPLKKGSRVALFGAGATHMIKGGTGSGDVNEREAVSVFRGLSDAGFEITTKEWIEEYDRIYAQARLSWREDIWEKVKEDKRDKGMAFFLTYSANPFHMPNGPAITATEADTAIYIVSRVAGEGADRSPEKGDWFLTDSEREAMETA